MDRIQANQTTQYHKILDILEEQGYTFPDSLVKDGLEALLHILMDLEVNHLLSASLYERSANRRAYRNGYRTSIWNTSVGDITLRIPKLRRGTYYPDRLLNDEQVGDSLIRLVKICILRGVDEYDVQDILSTLNLTGLSTYELHQVCEGLSRGIQASIKQNKTIETNHSSSPYSQNHLASSHQEDGKRQRLIVNVEEISELDRKFWHDFTRRMAQSGLMVDDIQSILSSINPYAMLQLDESHSIIHLNFARHIHSMYEDEYQLVA